MRGLEVDRTGSGGVISH